MDTEELSHLMVEKSNDFGKKIGMFGGYLGSKIGEMGKYIV